MVQGLLKIFLLGYLQVDAKRRSLATLTDRQREISAELVTIRSEHEARAIEKASNTADWVQIDGVPDPLPGYVRIFRGVKPRAIATELSGPASSSEMAGFDQLLQSIQDGSKSMDSLSSDEQRTLNEMSGRSLNRDAEKFYADDVSRAMRYAENGCVYYVDVPEKQLRNYYKENGMQEFAFKLPWSVAKRAEVYAVGHQVQPGSVLKPRKI